MKIEKYQKQKGCPVRLGESDGSDKCHKSC